MPSLLIIDDDETITMALRHHFQSLLWEVAGAPAGESGLLLAETAMPDVILLDMRLPDLEGMEVLRRLKAGRSTASIIVMTGAGSIANAVEAVKAGAEQYLTKPVDLGELGALLDRILETRKLRLENRYYRQRMSDTVVGASTETNRLHHMIDLMAENADTTVLLQGESGTGKELAAREIHRKSRRGDRPFLDINCAVLSETLLESELFGHERGAFTDARARKPGLLEVADGGTVFLDEIGELPPAVQPKLLRVLETRAFKRVGGTRDLRVDVRVIAATNRDLEGAVAAGRFREDLYYRIKVFPVDLPPLRGRPADIPVLIRHFTAYYSEALKKTTSGFTPEAMGLLAAYSWPGNVRELKNVVERAMVLGRGAVLDVNLLPKELAGTLADPSFANASTRNAEGVFRRLEEVERDYIQSVLRVVAGNRSLAARELGIARSTLLDKLKKYGIGEDR
jgi:DNA-binding NtrC family response regulator